MFNYAKVKKMKMSPAQRMGGCVGTVLVAVWICGAGVGLPMMSGVGSNQRSERHHQDRRPKRVVLHESVDQKDRLVAEANHWFHHKCTVPNDSEGLAPELPPNVKVARFDGDQLSLVVSDEAGQWYFEQAPNTVGRFKVTWSNTGCQAIPIGVATLVIAGNGLADLAMTGCGALVTISKDEEVAVQVDATQTPCVLQGRTRKGNMNEERHTIRAAIDVPDLLSGDEHVVTAIEIAED